MTEIELLKAEQKDVILNVCNKIGCTDCEMKWDEGGKQKCRSTDLQNQIWNLKGLEW